MTIECRPVTASNLDDLFAVFGEQGASCGCWCMFWRIAEKDFARNGNDGNRAGLLNRIGRGEVPGILAYVDGVSAGWCSVAPRETFRGELAGIEGTGVWSITCLFIPKPARHQGIAQALVTGAVEHVRRGGGRIVEAYPAPVANEAAYMGTESMFTGAGFRCAGGDPTVYRLELSQP